MTKELKALLEKRGQLAAKMEATLSTIETEKRANKPEETELLAQLNQDINDLNIMIEARQKLNVLDTASFKPDTKSEDNAAAEFRSNFVLYLRGKMDEKQFRAMTAGTATAGAELVPPEFQKQVLAKILEYGVIMSRAYLVPTTTNGELSVPTIDDTANAGAWTAEAGAITAADFVTGDKTMKAYKATTAIVVSREFLEDAFFDVETYIIELLAIRLGRVFEAAFINGDGTGKPYGIVADTGTKALTSTASIVVDEADALRLVGAIQPTSRNGAEYFASDSMIMAMAGWVDGNGRPLLQVASDATQANGLTYTLHGYPVVPNYELGDAVTAGDVPLIFGNAKNYWVRMVRNILVQRSDEVNILNDQIVFVATVRLDGKLMTANDGFAKMTVKV